jgi:hypothetical protein
MTMSHWGGEKNPQCKGDGTHLPIEKLLNRRQPLFPVHTYPNFLPFLIFLNSEDDRRYVEVAENGIYQMDLFRF